MANRRTRGRGVGRAAVAVLLLTAPALVACSSQNPLEQVEDDEPPALPRLSVQQTDVTDRYTVTVFPDGTQTQGVPTLDICAATYPSEQLRLARRQVAVVDAEQRLHLSTEAVAYGAPADTAQAFRELREVEARCPREFQAFPGSGELFLTVFNPRPDTNWPPPPAGVERLAFDLLQTDEAGNTYRSVAVYLRRGRILLGVYFYIQPDAPVPAVEGKTTIDAIVGVFAARLSQLPAKIVTG
jgi:hypothetical protein